MKLLFIILMLFALPEIDDAQINLNPSFYVTNLYQSSIHKYDFYIYYSFQEPLKVQNANFGFNTQMQKITNDVELFKDPTYHYGVGPNNLLYFGFIFNMKYPKYNKIYHNF